MNDRMLRLWCLVDRLVHFALRPWLWYGRWQSERVIDWYLGRVVAQCLYWEEMTWRKAHP